MTTYHERAVATWDRHGRIDATGRLYLHSEYIGRIGTDDQGQPFTYAKGERAVGYIGVNPVAVTAQYLMSGR